MVKPWGALSCLCFLMNDENRLNHWLETLVKRGGSDLFLVVGAPPSLRISGGIREIEEPPPDGSDIEKAILPVLPARAAELYRATGSCDNSIRIDGLGRFRINLHRERGRPAATIRALAMQPPRFAELNLPTSVL